MEKMRSEDFLNPEEERNLEGELEKGIQSLSGPLPERLGMLFTALQIETLENDMKEAGIELELLSAIQEDGARDISTLLENYFEPNATIDKLSVLEMVKKYLENSA